MLMRVMTAFLVPCGGLQESRGAELVADRTLGFLPPGQLPPLSPVFAAGSASSPVAAASNGVAGGAAGRPEPSSRELNPTRSARPPGLRKHPQPPSENPSRNQPL